MTGRQRNEVGRGALEYFQDVVMLELSMAWLDKAKAITLEMCSFKHKACICVNVSLHQDVGREVGTGSSRVEGEV